MQSQQEVRLKKFINKHEDSLTKDVKVAQLHDFKARILDL